MRLISLKVLAALLLAAVMSACSRQEVPVMAPRVVHVVTVSHGGNALNASYTGDVHARFESDLGFRVPGKIVERRVDVGARVIKGQVIARLDPADMRLSAEAAASQLQAARSDFNQTKADLDRFRELRDKQFISEAEFERRQTAFDVARARYEQAQAQLSMSRNQTGYAVLVADHEGVVTAQLAEVGQVVSAGQPVVRLARAGEKEVEIPVPESRLRELGVATRVQVSMWAIPDKRYQGVIREVSPSADSVTRTYAVRVSVIDADEGVQYGMTANVFIDGQVGADTVVLPPTAVFKQAGKASVWVVDEGSQQVRAVPVEVAEFRQDAVIVSGGLRDGQRVVRAGVHKLFEGEKVRPIVPSAAS